MRFYALLNDNGVMKTLFSCIIFSVVDTHVKFKISPVFNLKPKSFLKKRLG